MPPYTRRDVIKYAGALSLSAALVGAAGEPRSVATPSAQQTCFGAYDNTTYTNLDIGQRAGFPQSSILYSGAGRTWRERLRNNEPPPRDGFKAWVRAKWRNAPGPLVIDFEQIFLRREDSCDEACVMKRFDTWDKIVTWTNEVKNETGFGGRKFGIYNFSLNYGSQFRDLAADIAGRTDIHFPSLYYWVNNTPERWEERLTAAVTKAKALSANKPIYPYIAPQYQGPDKDNFGGFIGGTKWRANLDAILERADGFVIWNRYVHNANAQPGQRWVSATASYIDALPSPGTCS